VPDSVPLDVRVGCADVVQVGAVRVTDVEEVAEHPYGVALPAVAQERGDRDLQVLSEQVEQGGLDGRDRVHRRAQVEGLGAATARVTVGERGPDRPQDVLVVTHAGADDQGFGVAQGPRDLLTAGHLAEAGAALGVLQDDDVAGEVRGMGAGEVEEHRVPAGDRIHGEAGDDGLAHGGSCRSREGGRWVRP